MPVLLLVWIAIIFIGTCTSNVHRLFVYGEISFNFISNPNWLDLFHLYPISEISKIETAGHFFMFFILTALLSAVFRNFIVILFAGISYGILTEVLQLFFSRGADLYDVAADTVGVFTCFLLTLIGIWLDPHRQNTETVKKEIHGSL